jgi:hypothetical protein
MTTVTARPPLVKCPGIVWLKPTPELDERHLITHAMVDVLPDGTVRIGIPKRSAYQMVATDGFVCAE